MSRERLGFQMRVTAAERTTKPLEPAGRQMGKLQATKITWKLGLTYSEFCIQALSPQSLTTERMDPAFFL